jgi:hypothetical protein
MRKARGADLAYLAALPSYLAEVRRSVHEADLDAIATVRAATASKHEGRRQRRQLPKGSRIRTVAPGEPVRSPLSDLGQEARRPLATGLTTAFAPQGQADRDAGKALLGSLPEKQWTRSSPWRLRPV